MSLAAQQALMGFALATAGAPLLAGEREVQVDVHGQGFMVRAAAGVSSLEVRLMGPSRTVIFERRTDGAPIYWNLAGIEGDGDYRKEAMAVTETGDYRESGPTAYQARRFWDRGWAGGCPAGVVRDRKTRPITPDT